MEWVWIQWLLKVIVIPLLVVMWVSINKKIDKSMDKELCDEKHNTLKTRLDKDDEKFNEISQKLDRIIVNITKLETTLTIQSWKKKDE